MKEGFRTVLESDEVVISKEGEQCATGERCAQTDMIILSEDTEPPMKATLSAAKEQRNNILALHNVLGHCGNETVRLTFGLKDQSNVALDCEMCARRKRRQRDIPKSASNPPSELLEIIELDLQGPFPVTGADGTRMNLKMVDSHSGYVKTVNIPNKRADTIVNAFKGFQNRLERRTGKKIISIRCDSGT